MCAQRSTVVSEFLDHGAETEESERILQLCSHSLFKVVLNRET